MEYTDLTSTSDEILFLGDVLPHRAPPQPITHDIPFIINLEAPIVEQGRPIPGKINLKTSRRFLEAQFAPQPIAVSLANNHVLDYGNEGFRKTLQVLEEMDINYFGAGTEQDNFNNPLLLKINNIRVAIFGYCYAHYYDQISPVEGLEYGPAPLEPERIRRDIKQIRDNVDLVVLQLHWGTLYSNFPTDEDVDIARNLADHGADIIVGHHSHTIQPIEVYHNTIIAYSLGNYLFPDLNLPAYFDHSGVATRYKVEKQRAWNRSSAGLLVNLKTKKHTIRHFFDRNDKIIEKKRYYHRYLTYKIPENLAKLQPLIEKNLRIKKNIRLMLSLIENPRLPSSWPPGKRAARGPEIGAG